jgi:hypothetical protein
VMYSLIVTAKMNDIDPQAWLADVLARIAEHPGAIAADALHGADLFLRGDDRASCIATARSITLWTSALA